MSRTIKLLDTSAQFSRITLKHIILSNSNVQLLKPSNLITIRSIHTKLSNQNSKRYYNSSQSSFHKKKHPHISLSQPSLSHKQKPKLIFQNTELIRLMNKSNDKHRAHKQNTKDTVNIKKINIRNKLQTLSKGLLTDKTKYSYLKECNNTVDTNKSCISFNMIKESEERDCFYKKICGVFLKGRNGRKRSVINQRKLHMEHYESQVSFNERTMSLPVINLLKLK